TRKFCDHMLRRLGVETTYYDPLIGAGIAALMRPNTRLVFLESPGSLTFEVQDAPAIAAAAKAAGAAVLMDTTWPASLLCRPFELGVDISIQAGTKYIVGHSDAMLGLITTNEAFEQKVRLAVQELGQCAAPDDVYLALRGLRTLSVRLARHQETGLALARWLAARPEVERVLHPALPGDPGNDLWRRDFSGASGLFGVVLRAPCPRAAVAAMIEGMELFGLGSSWGGFESLMIAAYPERTRSATTWDAPGRTLRIHAGLEHPADLIADLEAGFERFNRAVRENA
ncbi:MAG: cystathionine beta-lyase, partial [Rhodospirillales bacterium]|nr:cystathionine beta-lyase [Rhodospirillales bacterium]